MWVVIVFAVIGYPLRVELVEERLDDAVKLVRGHVGADDWTDIQV